MTRRFFPGVDSSSSDMGVGGWRTAGRGGWLDEADALDVHFTAQEEPLAPLENLQRIQCRFHVRFSGRPRSRTCQPGHPAPSFARSFGRLPAGMKSFSFALVVATLCAFAGCYQ